MQLSGSRTLDLEGVREEASPERGVEGWWSWWKNELVSFTFASLFLDVPFLATVVSRCLPCLAAGSCGLPPGPFTPGEGCLTPGGQSRDCREAVLNRE